MSFIDNALLKLARGLYPKARAFSMPMPKESAKSFVSESGSRFIMEDGSRGFSTEGDFANNGILYRLHRAIRQGDIRLYDAGRSTYDSILPDNENFSVDDAKAWERRLKISTSNTDLDTRKLAIQRKMNYPGNTAPRQSGIYLQQQLQDAGFDVYVYPNAYPDGSGGYVSYTPYQALGNTNVRAVAGYFGSGQAGFGQLSPNIPSVVANFIESDHDATFDVGSNFNSTFFISGATLQTFASVPLNRKNEFRQLILHLKRAQTVAILFVNYT